MKPVCQPCRQQGREREVRCLLLFSHHHVNRHSQCTWTKNPLRKPRTEHHFEAMHKRAENLSVFVREYRTYADYLESLLEQCQQDYHPHYKVDFRVSRPSDPDGLLGPSPNVLDHNFDFTIMGADDHDGSFDSGSDPTKELCSPIQSLKVCRHPCSLLPACLSCHAQLEEGGLIDRYGNTTPILFKLMDRVEQDNDSFPLKLVDKIVSDHRERPSDPDGLLGPSPDMLKVAPASKKKT